MRKLLIFLLLTVAWTLNAAEPVFIQPNVSQILESYDELTWLANGQVKKTEEGIDLKQSKTYSEQLFQEKFPEFDRTMTSLVCLELVIQGGDVAYQQFTAQQNSAEKLSRDSFNDFHNTAIKLLQSHPQLAADTLHHAMQVALLFGDMGKTPHARILANQRGIDAVDHDDFIEAVLHHCPDIFPTWKTLAPAAQELLREATGLAHFGHIYHLEGGVSMFHALKERDILNRDPFVFEFAYFIHCCDVSAALGHLDSTGSRTVDQNTYQMLMAVKDSCMQLKTENETAAYKHLLNRRAEYMNFDTTEPLERVLTRVGAMLRIFSAQEGQVLRDALQQLSQEDVKLIAEELDDISLPRTPTYVPAVLLNLSNHSSLGASRQERLQKAVTIGLPFIAAVLKQYRLNSDEHTVHPLNFNPIAGYVKTHPENLAHCEFAIDAEGMVSVVPAS